MSGSGVAILAILVILVIAAIAAVSRLAAAVRYEAREARHARRPFADPADLADPDGGQWLGALRAADDFPFPVAGCLVMPPPGPPPAETAELPVVQCELGGRTTGEYVDEVFARHADRPVMLP